MVDFLDKDFNRKWNIFLDEITELVGKKPDLNALLFLIGVQELGKGKLVFTKEQKQDLMHIATCRLLSTVGFYEFEGLDEEGWPHWKATAALPKLNIIEQEKLLKLQILEYFEEMK